MKAYELTSWLEKKYPSDAAEDWDNVGLLAGDDTNEISHVFLALDLTEETLAEAIEDGADMIITHHPMIFSGIKKINNHRKKDPYADTKRNCLLCDAYQL